MSCACNVTFQCDSTKKSVIGTPATSGHRLDITKDDEMDIKPTIKNTMLWSGTVIAHGVLISFKKICKRIIVILALALVEIKKAYTIVTVVIIILSK